MFEKASRQRLRFTTSKGLLTVEDLWSLSLTMLNFIAKSLNSEIKSASEEDFLEDINPQDEIIKLKFDIVLYILRTKQKEKNLKINEKAIKEEDQKLLRLIEEKKDKELSDLSIEELQKKRAELKK
jgi:hypothetical protein